MRIAVLPPRGPVPPAAAARFAAELAAAEAFGEGGWLLPGGGAPDVLLAQPAGAAEWGEILSAPCPSIVDLGGELPAIARWAAALQAEGPLRVAWGEGKGKVAPPSPPDPPIWPWDGTGTGAAARALLWWAQARVRRDRPPPWHACRQLGDRAIALLEPRDREGRPAPPLLPGVAALAAAIAAVGQGAVKNTP